MSSEKKLAILHVSRTLSFTCVAIFSAPALVVAAAWLDVMSPALSGRQGPLPPPVPAATPDSRPQGTRALVSYVTAPKLGKPRLGAR